MTTQDPNLSNPLLQEWGTPYATPPFDLIRPEHYVPAFTAAIEMAREEVERIKHNPVECGACLHTDPAAVQIGYRTIDAFRFVRVRAGAAGQEQA